MKFIVFPFFCFVILSCNGNLSENNNDKIIIKDSIFHKPLFKLEGISSKEYYNLKNKRIIAPIQKMNIKKDGNKIRLPLDNGKCKLFVDTLNIVDETKNQTFNLIGFHEQINSYLLSAAYYEGGEFLLVNKENGEVCSLWSEPLISPDSSRIMTYGSSLGYDIMPNGIKYCKFIDNKFINIWEFKTQSWKPEELFWITNNLLIMKQIIPDYISITKKEQINYFKLLLD